LPKSQKTRSLPERLTALGLDPVGIQKVADMIDALLSIGAGEMDEVPEGIRRRLVEEEEAELSALDQLQDILDARRSQ